MQITIHFENTRTSNMDRDQVDILKTLLCQINQQVEKPGPPRSSTQREQALGNQRYKAVGRIGSLLEAFISFSERFERMLVTPGRRRRVPSTKVL
ncbi:hypothetical protein ACSSV1_005467 [Labrenzia sp. MBR-25]